MNNLDKAINELLQLTLVDNKPVYLTQLNELYECKKKEETLKLEIEQSINRAYLLRHSDYVQPVLLDLFKLQLKEASLPKGYTLDELVTKHNIDLVLLKLALDQQIKEGNIKLHGVLNSEKHIVEERYYSRFKYEDATYY